MSIDRICSDEGFGYLIIFSISLKPSEAIDQGNAYLPLT